MMMIAPILRARLGPVLRTCINQTRNIRPSIKIDKETFQLILDVRQFDKEEIRVKARPEFIIVEGKQERKTKDGFVIRQFVRRFKLPIGCDPATIKTELSPNGMLKVTAPRKFCEKNLPCERIVPISAGENEDVDQPLISPDESIKPAKDPCSAYIGEKKEKKESKLNLKPDEPSKGKKK